MDSYIFYGLAIILLILSFIKIFNRQLGWKALSITGNSVKKMLLVIPPIFILLGLLDVWVPRETMIKYMGEGSGLKGVLLAIFIGSAAAGPLYGAFPASSKAILAPPPIPPPNDDDNFKAVCRSKFTHLSFPLFYFFDNIPLHSAFIIIKAIVFATLSAAFSIMFT